MQAATNSVGRAATRPQAGPANDCIASRTSGASRRYRLSSPITRQARSLGVTDGVAALAGVRGKMDGGALKLAATVAFSPARGTRPVSQQRAFSRRMRALRVTGSDDEPARIPGEGSVPQLRTPGPGGQ